MDSSDIIAILALIVALAEIVVTAYQSRNMNSTNLQAMYFEEIFKEYMINKIPKAADNLHYDGDLLSPEYRVLVDVMMDMVGACKYFAYAKYDFYSELQEKCIALEDELIRMANNPCINEQRQRENIYHIHEAIVVIIRLINNNYHKF